MKRLTSLESYLKYYNNNLNDLQKPKTTSIIGYFNSQDFFKDNKELNTDVFRLGWNSIAVIKHKQTYNRLKVIEIYKKQNGSFNQIFTNTDNTINDSYLQIVTHAVLTCTFVHISIGDSMHIFAHLDKSDLKDGLNIISAELSKQNNKGQKIIGVCSHIYAKEENDFAFNIGNLCNSTFCNQYRHKGTDFLLETDESAINKLIDENLLSHMEIGLSIEGKAVCLFGDISDVSKPPENEDDGKSVPTKLFESMEKFIEKMEEYRNQSGA